MRLDLSALRQLSGFVDAAVVDSETGFVLGRLGGSDADDLQERSAVSVDLVRAARKFGGIFSGQSDFEDAIVIMEGEVHFARALRFNPAILIYLSLERKEANLALALMTLRGIDVPS